MPPRLPVLVVARSDRLRDLVVDSFGSWPVHLAGSAEAAAAALGHQRFALVVVTNFGLGPLAAINAVPAVRTFPALYLGGVVNATVREACQLRRIPIKTVPIPLSELHREIRLALDAIEL
jgi:hypothetical protein